MLVVSTPPSKDIDWKTGLKSKLDDLLPTRNTYHWQKQTLA
jgi:hypothetical protein